MKTKITNMEQLSETIDCLKGSDAAKACPFLTSKAFGALIEGVAALPKVVIIGSGGPAEALNGILSVVVTFLKNVPDKLWDMLLKASASEPDCAASKSLKLLDDLRNFQGKCAVVEIPDHETPAFNAPIPKHPC